eukprot:2595953-Rhodomonas_salina.1
MLPPPPGTDGVLARAPLAALFPEEPLDGAPELGTEEEAWPELSPSSPAVLALVSLSRLRSLVPPFNPPLSALRAPSSEVTNPERCPGGPVIRTGRLPVRFSSSWQTGRPRSSPPRPPPPRGHEKGACAPSGGVHAGGKADARLALTPSSVIN